MTRFDEFALAVPAFIAVLPLWPQQPQATLGVQTADRQAIFHIGERIPLQLTFTSPNDTEYTIAPDYPPCGEGRAPEKVEASPATGWSDPLAVYVAWQSTSGCMMTAPYMRHPLLHSTPVQASLDLNQLIRFDQPGNYTVKITSSRVATADKIVSLSAEIHLQIVAATPDWQAAKMKAIRAGLDIPNRANQTYANAVEDLRYFATPDGIEEMTSRLRQVNDYVAIECKMGLIGLPDSLRDAAIASLNKRIGDPDFPVTDWFFEAFSFLRVNSGPGSDSDIDSIRHQVHTSNLALWQIVLAAARKKNPIARALTAQVLLRYGDAVDDPATKSEMASLLFDSFMSLDNTSQLAVLRVHWDLVRSPAWLPVLKDLAELQPVPQAGFERNNRENLRSIALKRWYDLDPDGAHREIFSEIGSATPMLSENEIAFLPRERLRQFEPIWAQAFLATTDRLQVQTLGSLLVQFGTGAATQQMIAKLDQPPGPQTCDAHEMAFAYLALFRADEARSRLKSDVAANDRECRGMLKAISDFAPMQVVNDAAVELLDNPDPGVVQDAIQYLTSYGRSQDEEPLWNRYVQWTDAWRGKADRLDHPDSSLDPSAQLGTALATALLTNQGWLADQSLISKVLERCIGQTMCERLKGIARSASPPFRVLLVDSSGPLGTDFPVTYLVCQYAPRSLEMLELKVAQFPRGSEFVFSTAGYRSSDLTNLENKARAIFEKKGMTLESPPN